MIPLRWKRRGPKGQFRLTESVAIAAGVGRVFDLWTRYEDLPRILEHVRRTKRIDEGRVLWDVDVAGHQVVWEARILESEPGKRVRWESSWGAASNGELRFEELSGGGTRLTVEIEFRAQTPLEHLGARLGLADLHVRRDLSRFRRFVESLPAEPQPAGAAPTAARGHRPPRRGMGAAA